LLDSDIQWENTLWEWVYSTRDRIGEHKSYIGGNSISIMALMGKSFDGIDLSNTTLSHADLDEAIFSNANLSKSDLSYSALNSAKLQFANLLDADLTSTKLAFADLSSAKFVGASLKNSNIYNAILNDTDFSNADLGKSNLTRSTLNQSTNFQNANLYRAKIWTIQWIEESLSGARLRTKILQSDLFKGANLESVQYAEPVPERKSFFCFTAGTQVTMANGCSRSIENIQLGDDVLSYCTRTKEFVTSTVHKLIRANVNKIIIINKKLTTTPSEAFYSGNQWVLAKDLKIGDILVGRDGAVKITAIENKQKSEKIFNFSVPPYHSFFAEGFLVHNHPTKVYRSGL
ncbi:MAG: pentapeptide repeat-containing protein, partial [Chloroflexota bacterium]